MSVRRGIYVAPFDELAEPSVMAELARSAEQRGWEGLFLWDHVNYRAPVQAVADVWITLAAIASATERLRIGPMVTPLSRRRIQKVARETVTLDHLSGGRLTFGVGLGSARNGELEPFGEVVDPRERARLLDQGMERLAGSGPESSNPPRSSGRVSRSGSRAAGRIGGPSAGRRAGTASSRSTSLDPRTSPRSPQSFATCAATGTIPSTLSSRSSRAVKWSRGRPPARPGS
jgi:alkanesulfonate monooxygenase SsuD/methylene tetrahydromethanopterin reductase-like flavin-dependent oxidoreductase (luciferase family)